MEISPLSSARAAAVIGIATVIAGCSGDLGSTGERAGGAAAAGSSSGSGPDATLGTQSLVCHPGARVVGETPLRRLTRTQYINSVHDVFGVTVDASSFPEDERAGAFAANARAPVSEAHVQRYADAAEAVATAAVAAPNIAKLVPCDAQKGDDACAVAFLRATGRRAFRRALRDDEVAALKAVYDAGKTAGGFVSGVRLAVGAIAQAPSFLYLVETKEAAPGEALVMLSDDELATRLSYYLWQTTPDDELIAVSEAGTLRTTEGLRAQAKRLLDHPRARAMLADFTTNWLGIDSVEKMTRDETLFPAFNADIARAMKEETVAFVDHVFNEGDGSLTTLMTASYSYPGARVLPTYGPGVSAASDPSRPVMLPPAQRAGLLTQPSFLTATSSSDRTSPVRRGVKILHDFLCYEVPPPTGVKIPPLPPRDPNKTTREQLLGHQVAGCAGCHEPIDNIGFAFERFDPTGAIRDTESGKPIDDTGGIVIGSATSDGPAHGAVELVTRIAASEELHTCVIKQWQRFALGRTEVKDDACATDELRESFTHSDFDLRGLVLDIVTKDTFRFRPATPAAR